MAKEKAKKPRNRAAQDATLLNIRALKKRVAILEDHLDALIHVVQALKKAREKVS